MNKRNWGSLSPSDNKQNASLASLDQRASRPTIIATTQRSLLLKKK